MKKSEFRRSPICFLSRWWIVIVVSFVSVFSVDSQELEARRWAHLPTGMEFAGLAYAYTEGDIQFDPVLRLADVDVELHSSIFKYVAAFELFEKSVRFDFLQAYQQGRWEGTLDGLPASTSRTGWSDSVIRFSMNLLGGPPLKGEEYVNYRKSVAGGETIVGAGLAIHLPTGHYLEDKLLNLGTNRFTFRPQLGIVHNRGPWSFETTGNVWLFTENDEFFGGNVLEQSPLYTIQGHVVYTFRPGLWLAAGAGYGTGAQSTLNGVEKNDRKGNLGWGVTLGIPVTKRVGLKLGYVGLRTREAVGADLDTGVAAVSFQW